MLLVHIYMSSFMCIAGVINGASWTAFGCIRALTKLAKYLDTYTKIMHGSQLPSYIRVFAEDFFSCHSISYIEAQNKE
jgi:hypothetical protein